MPALAERVSFLEDLMQRVAYTQMQANMSIDQLSKEMREFKDEMHDFKDEMRDFKNEMLEFKDEMRDFKDEMREFKDEMLDFKDEMREFKDEMSEYKDWSKEQITRMNRQWGDLANKLGTVVEDIVAPNIPGIAKRYFGCDELDYIAIRVKKRSIADRSRRREFDAIAACEGIFIVNETKSSPETRDIDQFAEFIGSKELFDYFPEYRECRICPVFSSLYMDEAFVAYLSRKGIYALAMKNDTMDILNFDSMKMT
jgi:gas vesicle protein